MDVLIVDNEPAFAELLAARLELQGYRPGAVRKR